MMIKDNTIALHIEIFYANIKELVNIIRDFLFCFLIMKNYSLNMILYIMEKNIKLKLKHDLVS